MPTKRLQKRVEVTCNKCNKSYLKARNGLYTWSGMCMSCSKKAKPSTHYKVIVKCKTCGMEKSVNNNIAPLCGEYCRKCKPFKTKYVTCKQCGIGWDKRESNIPAWNGYCRSCAYKIRYHDQKYVEIARANGKAMMARHGGYLPNRNIFTKEQVGGHKNNNWKGGITPEVVMIRSSDAYAKWRSDVYSRDQYTCQHCFKVGGRLNAHHILPFSTHPELRLVLSNGISLCTECHKLEHKRMTMQCHQKDELR